MIEILVYIMIGCLIMAFFDIFRLEIKVKDLQDSILMLTSWTQSIQDIMLDAVKKEKNAPTIVSADKENTDDSKN